MRDEAEVWKRVESYFKEAWDLDFTHGYCPECFEATMAELRAPRAGEAADRTEGPDRS